MKYVIIEGKRIAWRDIFALRKEQKKAQRQQQLTLFELKEDARPQTQHTADGRYQEPLLFE